MPIYEYTCPKCGNIFEEWVKSASDPETDSCTCPSCGADSFRMISNTSFHLKGSGWFASSYPSTSTSSSSEANTTKANETNTTKTETTSDKN